MPREQPAASGGGGSVQRGPHATRPGPTPAPWRQQRPKLPTPTADLDAKQHHGKDGEMTTDSEFDLMTATKEQVAERLGQLRQLLHVQQQLSLDVYETKSFIQQCEARNRELSDPSALYTSLNGKVVHYTKKLQEERAEVETLKKALEAKGASAEETEAQRQEYQRQQQEVLARIKTDAEPPVLTAAKAGLDSPEVAAMMRDSAFAPVLLEGLQALYQRYQVQVATREGGGPPGGHAAEPHGPAAHGPQQRTGGAAPASPAQPPPGAATGGGRVSRGGDSDAGKGTARSRSRTPTGEDNSGDAVM